MVPNLTWIKKDYDPNRSLYIERLINFRWFYQFSDGFLFFSCFFGSETMLPGGHFWRSLPSSVLGSGLCLGTLPPWKWQRPFSIGMRWRGWWPLVRALAPHTRFMGLPRQFFVEIPPGHYVTNYSLTALVNLNMLYDDFLRCFACQSVLLAPSDRWCDRLCGKSVLENRLLRRRSFLHVDKIAVFITTMNWNGGLVRGWLRGIGHTNTPL